jgi:hypothetical protein
VGVAQLKRLVELFRIQCRHKKHFFESSALAERRKKRKSHTFLSQHKVWVSAALKRLCHEFSGDSFFYQLCRFSSYFELRGKCAQPTSMVGIDCISSLSESELGL